ncbi:hypothetical protein BJ085DRAFT_39205 [Dimargaris cristalligena]|uniref:Uncharacterized protein n=1 Tax=Dimargaris cristalligena TaxID=215637 RepID=A0A4P9ZM40_9FUNG|nr:hypothetical protein BJ085DRAFT_39205 [Dimargaris cristalligena]|eukprot:RKP34386.1 hypothetical protein BJ085DRAFT_39205 [Dimargaris cristalligena]
MPSLKEPKLAVPTVPNPQLTPVVEVTRQLGQVQITSRRPLNSSPTVTMTSTAAAPLASLSASNPFFTQMDALGFPPTRASTMPSAEALPAQQLLIPAGPVPSVSMAFSQSGGLAAPLIPTAMGGGHSAHNGQLGMASMVSRAAPHPTPTASYTTAPAMSNPFTGGQPPNSTSLSRSNTMTAPNSFTQGPGSSGPTVDPWMQLAARQPMSLPPTSGHSIQSYSGMVTTPTAHSNSAIAPLSLGLTNPPAPTRNFTMPVTQTHPSYSSTATTPTNPFFSHHTHPTPASSQGHLSPRAHTVSQTQPSPLFPPFNSNGNNTHMMPFKDNGPTPPTPSSPHSFIGLMNGSNPAYPQLQPSQHSYHQQRQQLTQSPSHFRPSPVPMNGGALGPPSAPVSLNASNGNQPDPFANLNPFAQAFGNPMASTPAYGAHSIFGAHPTPVATSNGSVGHQPVNIYRMASS